MQSELQTQSTLSALDRLVASPFARLNALIEGIEPGLKAMNWSLGEPDQPLPDFLLPTLQDSAQAFCRYPPIKGTDELRQAIKDWLDRRYPPLQGRIAPETQILPLNGSREGLFSASFPARARRPDIGRPAVLIPNPFYQVYVAAAVAAGAEPVFLSATAETDSLPDLDALPAELLQRTIAFYLCSPSNPEGAVADEAYLSRAIGLAREHDFLLFADECYSEIYSEAPPPGALATACAQSGDCANVVAFNSLSKRSSLPGLRSGFVAGDEAFLTAFLRFRNVACPQTPGPIQSVAASAWRDEAHVAAARAAYQANFDVADEVLGQRYGYRRPQGGFFLWLNMDCAGGGELAAKTLWKACGVKVLPGGYLARVDSNGRNPGQAYVRVALVHDASVTRQGLTRIVETLG